MKTSQNRHLIWNCRQVTRGSGPGQYLYMTFKYSYYLTVLEMGMSTQTLIIPTHEIKLYDFLKKNSLVSQE